MSGIDLSRPVVCGALLLATFAVPLLLFAGTSATIWTYWEQLNYRHGYFVLPLVLYLLINDRHRLVKPEPSTAALAVLAACLLVWLLARAVLIQIGEQVALVLICISTFWVVFGTRNTFAMRYPLAGLFLGVPFGDGSVPVLIEITTWLSSSGLSLSNVPFYREGNYLMLPGGSFEVAEACSGFKFLMTGLTLGFVAAYDMFDSGVKRTLFILGIVAGCIFLNALRAYLVMMVASASKMEYLAHDHEWFGWVIFAAGLFLMLLIGWRQSDSAQALRHA